MATNRVWRIVMFLAAFVCDISSLSGQPAPVSVTNSIGVAVTTGSNGVYMVAFVSPAWTFTGSLAQNLTSRTVNTGADNIGAYSEVAFNYTSAVPHSASIRLYNNLPVVTFNDTILAAGPNDLAFPHWTNYPMNLNHISFIDTFSVYSFAKLYEPWAPCDNLLLYFNTNYDSFIISAATNYTISSIWTNSDASISCGINSGIPQLPAAFTHRFVLASRNGINQVYSTWGNSLLALGGKTPPANDAVVELKKFGYWTDNGAAYYPYYNGTAPGIANTLLSVKSEFAGKGIPISYMQLDSWWYEKGSNAVWNDPSDGFYLYQADPYLFTNGLAGFQKQLALPLITHNRWVYTNSPYIITSNWTQSGGVMIDPRFWTNIMGSISNAGVVTYEQDWLNYLGVPNMNLTDPPAYLNSMAWAAAASGMNLQYCMVQGRDYLQATLFSNVMTIRTSEDRFDTSRWAEHLYGSRLAQAVGIWPWTDVCMSTETRNVLLQALSAGPVGTGDALGTVNATNLLEAARSDGIIVKPDVPLVPTDGTYVNDALGLGKPFIAATYTDHTNSLALYVFAYGETAANLTNSFRPVDLGITNSAYVYDYFAATGAVVSAGSSFNFSTTLSNVFTGGSYFIAVPIGASGLALVGDTGKFVTRGKKRISQLTDNGVLTATVRFAVGESSVKLLGYSPSYPSIAFSEGSGAIASYDTVTKQFTASILPDGTGAAIVQFGANGTPPPPPVPPATLAAESVNTSQINLAWAASSGAAGYNVKRGISGGGPYTNLTSLASTSFSDSGLTPGSTYSYVVTASNGGGESANSPEATASTVPVLSLQPAADAYVRDGGSASSNFGTATNLAVKYDGTVGDGFNRYTYLKFDVHALTNLLSARLILTPIQVDGIGNLAFERWSNDTWSENTITWNNQPAGSGTTITNVANFTLFTPAIVDLTTVVAGKATNDGLITIRITQPGANATRIDFCSREHPTNSWRPVLQYAVNNNTAPVLTVSGNQTAHVGVTLNLTNSATDSDVPAQTPTFSLLAAPANAVINSRSGVVTWRPIVTQANTTNWFTVRVADSGTPSMSATQSFFVAVAPLTPPRFSAMSAVGGVLVLQVSGDSGPDYQVQSSTNLLNWNVVLTTNSPAMPFVWTASYTNGPLNFFRILAGPPF